MFTFVRGRLELALLGDARRFFSLNWHSHGAVASSRIPWHAKAASNSSSTPVLRVAVDGAFLQRVQASQQLRSFATATAHSSGRGSTPTSLFFFISLASGLVGYGLAKSSLFLQSPGTNTPEFGSPKDIQRAIEELKTVFPEAEEKVSTDPDDLETHGFSPNDHHPGL